MSGISFIGVVFLAVLPSTRTADQGSFAVWIEYTSLTFAASVLLADALIHLLPHAGGGEGSGIVACLGGLGLVAVDIISGALQTKVKGYGIANLCVELLHNLVDGFTLGLSWCAGPAAGSSATLAVAVHELPQELGDFLVLRAAGFSTTSLLCWNFIASLSCGLGVVLVFQLEVTRTEAVQKVLFELTGGSFLALSLYMLIPQVKSLIEEHHTSRCAAAAYVWCAVVAAVAVQVVIVIGELEEHSGHGHGHGHGQGHGHHADAHSHHGHGHGSHEL
jgi:zinc and cadmium transporter